jgi:6-phosphogluconolactonase
MLDVMTRRTLVSATAAAALARGQARPRIYAYVGCYTTAQRNARGDGIHVYEVDVASGEWNHVQHVGELVNPSFLVMRRDQKALYSVHGDESYATAFSVDRETGKLTLINRAQTGGTNGVYQAVDSAGRFMLVANYGAGSVAVLPIRKDGGLENAVQVVLLHGQPGPHRVEQTASHPHQVIFDPSGRFVIVPDKGLDRIFVFAFDAASGKLTATAQGAAVARSGAGPRHAAFHPALPVMWTLNELGNTVTTYQWKPETGELRAVQILPTLPAEFTGESSGAEIAVAASGRFVYCSNRGHDSVAIFAADPRTGALAPAGWVPSQGRTPRFIGFDPSQQLLCGANEQSDTVVTWRADAAGGRLTAVGKAVKNGSPVTIAFAQWER